MTGTAFTLPRVHNKWAWFYRIRPSVCHTPEASTIYDNHGWKTAPFNHPLPPDAMRWGCDDHSTLSGKSVDFIDGVSTVAANGSPSSLSGGAACNYAFNSSMSSTGRFMQNSDADLLIVPSKGRLTIRTEHGDLDIEPLEIGLIPRGIRFQINKMDEQDDIMSGYLLENYGAHFVIPDLGPIGSNTGLAHPRHFLSPTATCTEEVKGPYQLVNKFQGHLWAGEIDHSPLDVVAWMGNYAPSKYDLRLFCCINSVTFDHPDPSIYTVLTSPTSTPGLANIDFVIFPPRWVVMENTFRPPWYHRNVMSEFMGLITGVYDAKPKDGKFVPGGSSLHNALTPHGPDAVAMKKAATEDTSKPERYRNTMAFMFESSLPWHPTTEALSSKNRDLEYCKSSWKTIQPGFNKNEVGCDVNMRPLERFN